MSLTGGFLVSVYVTSGLNPPVVQFFLCDLPRGIQRALICCNRSWYGHLMATYALRLYLIYWIQPAREQKILKQSFSVRGPYLWFCHLLHIFAIRTSPWWPKSAHAAPSYSHLSVGRNIHISVSVAYRQKNTYRLNLMYPDYTKNPHIELDRAAFRK